MELRGSTEYIVIHCSATKPSMDIGLREIRDWHVKDNGWRDVGYHFIIRRNGEVELGRNIKDTAAHAAGYNHKSIGIAMVGGMAEDDSTENNFTVFVDLSFNSQDMSTGFDNAMTLAEKVYDKFHLTNINNKCRQATVQLEPGETQVGGLYMITIRCVILCSKVVTQT